MFGKLLLISFHNFLLLLQSGLSSVGLVMVMVMAIVMVMFMVMVYLDVINHIKRLSFTNV